MAAQKTPTQKTYKINIGTESVNIDFLGSNRQFDWIESSLAYDKSDKHTTICDSYNVELATKTIKSVKLSNYTKIYSLTNEKNMVLTIFLKNTYYRRNLLLGVAISLV